MANYDSEKALLKKIAEKYKALLVILEEEGNENVSFAKRQIRVDINNIERFLYEDDEYVEYDEIFKLLKGNYYRMYPVRGGLTEFFIWRDDAGDRINANKLLNTVKDDIQDLFDIIDSVIC